MTDMPARLRRDIAMPSIGPWRPGESHAPRVAGDVSCRTGQPGESVAGRPVEQHGLAGRLLRGCAGLVVLAGLALGLVALPACAPSGLVAEAARGPQPTPMPAAPAPAPASAGAPRWLPLAADGLHDPRGPGITQLQQPADALGVLPPDTAGNMVRWMDALESGAITPRSSILPGTEVRLREDDIIIARFGSMPAVKFPHRQHTLWLDCSNCHPAPFKDKIGANRFSMMAILNGEQCGLCHGAVSFPLTECNRCHSVPNESLRRQASAATP